MELPNILLIAGVAVFTTTMILRIRMRYQREARLAAERRAAAQAAKEAERKRQAMTGEPPKVKLAASSRVAPDRVPLGEPFDAAFAGSVPPRSIAKWETEIHLIGRQIIGQIDSKSVVLQTLTMEANRAANRLEILIDHLESLLKNSLELRKRTETSTDSSISSENGSRENGSNVIPVEAASVQAKAFIDVLEELENDLDQFHDQAEEKIPTATILKVPPPDAVGDTEQSAKTVVRRLSASIALSSQNPLRSQETTVQTPSTPTPTPTPQPQRPGLSFTSLFDDSLVERLDEPLAVSVARPSVPRYETPLIEQPPPSQPAAAAVIDNRFVSEIGAHLDVRKQVEMLADYGYSARQIAQSLNITVGEVELMISLRN